MPDIDGLIVLARQTAADLNHILGALAEHGVLCLSVDNPRSHDRTFGGRRVELMLFLTAAKDAA